MLLRLFALCLLLFSARVASAQTPSKPLRVLLVSGDWKSSAWVQDVWMGGGGEKLLRGRFLAQQVERAAPGRFEFTDINSYLALQYGDEAFFSGFDVIFVSEIVGWSVPPRFHAGLKRFVERGGGFVYAASFRWPFALLKDTPFEEVLPARFPVSGFTEDWKNGPIIASSFDFQARVVLPDHPVAQGLDWKNIPTLAIAANILPHANSQTVLTTPNDEPILTLGSFGQGRSAISSSIGFNDDASAKLGEWNDFGRYYAGLFVWLGANSKRSPAQLKAEVPEVQVEIDATKSLAGPPIGAKTFSIHGAQETPGLSPLEGQALRNYAQLNLRGGWARMDCRADIEPQNDNDDPNTFNRANFHFGEVDKGLTEMKRLDLEPVLLFPFNYNKPDWMWKQNGCTWSNATPKAAEELAELVAATVEHVNGGKGTSPDYKLRARYIEVLNEPNVDDRNMDAFVRLFQTVARRIHRDYPGVEVGAFGNHEVPYLKTFLQKVDPDLDWISSHPYSWTGEMIFAWQDGVRAFQRQHKLRPIPFFITEWDFWLQGRSKFDYLMRRNFEAARRPDLLGTLHYRLGEYEERGILYGVLWTGGAQKRGGGAKGQPMHDAYDAFYLWRDVRGARVLNSTQGTFKSFVHVEAARDGDKVGAVVYGDWGGGTEFNRFSQGTTAKKIKISLRLKVAPSKFARTVTLGRANGEGFSLAPPKRLAPNATQWKTTLALFPMSGWSVTISP